MSMLVTEPLVATRREARPHGGTRIDRDHELIDTLRVGSEAPRPARGAHGRRAG